MGNFKTTNCKVCNAEVAKSAKTCPGCGGKMGKPIFKRVWFWLIIVVVLLTIGGLGGGDNSEDPAASNVASTEPEINTTANEDSQDVGDDSELLASSEPAAPSKPAATMGQRNALNTAYDYLDYTSFSYSGLVAQLEYEGYSNADAVYAVDRCGADWNDQAAKTAADYLDYDSFSRDGLIAQLEYEGFSREQAIYGAGAVGY